MLDWGAHNVKENDDSSITLFLKIYILKLLSPCGLLFLLLDEAKRFTDYPKPAFINYLLGR